MGTPVADVVVDLQYGDCGKGKVVHSLIKHNTNKGSDYDLVVRFNGGCNAGHTIYHEGKKFITHLVPAGIFYGKQCLIGGSCVVDPEKFLRELFDLKKAGFDVENLVKISRNAHIVTNSHIREEINEARVGTTRTGNGPAYRDKHARIGIRAESMPELQSYLCDAYDMIWNSDIVNRKILLEGAQGFGLDIDWGDYPYVSSSTCTAAAAVAAGIPPSHIQTVYGVAKPYETYVGTKKFQGDNPLLDDIQRVGHEFGATTGRKRQCNWMDLDLLVRAANINGVHQLIINKWDVMKEVGAFMIKDKGHLVDLQTPEKFKHRIEKTVYYSCPNIANIHWSTSPEKI